MTVEIQPERIDVLVDRATRIVRLLAWLVALACAVLLFAILSAAAAEAEDPKAAAREIGRAGTTAAGAIAKSAGSAATVPGYAGTDVPERGIGAGALQDAANARLADRTIPAGRPGAR